ncbi:MAG TPA: hypothetical protein VFM69_04465 [Pricia sp.]|nr:hypothetical protein [Pricia sp.]
MKRLFFLCLLLALPSCADDNGGGVGGCLTASELRAERLTSKSSSNSTNEELVLEYLDSEGNNLIENNTYHPAEVALAYGNVTQTEVVELQNEDLKYLVWVVGFSKGKNPISVTLSPSETDTLLLYATEVGFSGCSGPSFAIDSVFYNGEKQALENISDWLKKVTVIK